MFTAEIKFIILDLTLLNYTAKVIEKCSSNNTEEIKCQQACLAHNDLMQIPETEQKAMTVDLYVDLYSKRKGTKERINEGNRTYFFLVFIGLKDNFC